MESSGLLRLIYIFFLGVLLALFVGIGINTFYPPPKAPAQPAMLDTYGKELTPAQVTVQQAYDRQMRQYNEQMKPYNRNVSIIALVCALLLFVASILLEHRLHGIADGIMLGGLFTLLYSLGRGLASEDSRYMFIVVAIGLAVVLYMGFRRFVRPSATP